MQMIKICAMILGGGEEGEGMRRGGTHCPILIACCNFRGEKAGAVKSLQSSNAATTLRHHYFLTSSLQNSDVF